MTPRVNPPATLSRRTFVGGAMAALATAAQGQSAGMAGGTASAQPRRPSSGRPYATFTDVAAGAGLLQPTIYGGVDRIQYIIESMGGGCAFIDYDNDGWIDLFLVGGTRLQGAPANATNRLYRNNRNGTFTDVTEQAGLHATGWGCGVCVGDYNNDGFEDLFITSYGQNRLYRNNGDGTFVDVTRSAGLEEAAIRFSTGCSFLDFNRDGLLDLFVANYVVFDLEHPPVSTINNPTCSFEGLPVYCGPRGLKPGRHSLYRNNGDGTFTDVSVSSGVAAITDSYGMTVVSGDFDGDGWPDIFVAADSSPSLLLMNNHDGTFREEALERGVAVSGDGAEQAGMGVGAGDPFNQGSTSLFVTHFLSETNGLYRNNGKGEFSDETLSARLGVETRFVGWGAAIADFDNDGLPDILWATGNVYPEIERKFPKYPLRGPRPLFRNLGDGTFEELTAEAGTAVNDRHTSRGLAVGDFNNDGSLDVLIVNLNEPPSLLRNQAPADNRWLKVMLVGTKSNRSAIGAQVTASFGGKRQMQERTSQSSYLSACEARLHFGLGASIEADISIRWPSGLQETVAKVPANHLLTVHEGEAGRARIAALPALQKPAVRP